MVFYTRAGRKDKNTSPFRALSEYVYISAINDAKRSEHAGLLERLELVDDDPDRVSGTNIEHCIICIACGKKFETEGLSLERVAAWIVHKLNCDKLQ